MGCSDGTFSIFDQIEVPFQIPIVSFPHVEKPANQSAYRGGDDHENHNKDSSPVRFV